MQRAPAKLHELAPKKKKVQLQSALDSLQCSIIRQGAMLVTMYQPKVWTFPIKCVQTHSPGRLLVTSMSYLAIVTMKDRIIGCLRWLQKCLTVFWCMISTGLLRSYLIASPVSETICPKQHSPLQFLGFYSPTSIERRSSREKQRYQRRSGGG